MVATKALRIVFEAIVLIANAAQGIRGGRAILSADLDRHVVPIDATVHKSPAVVIVGIAAEIIRGEAGGGHY